MSAMPKTDMLKTASRSRDKNTNKKSEEEERKVSSPNETVSRQRTAPTPSSMSSNTTQKILRESGTAEWKRQSGRPQNPGFYPSSSFWKQRKQEQMWEDIGFSKRTVDKIGELRGLRPPTGLQKILCPYLFGPSDVLVLSDMISDQVMEALLWPILDMISKKQSYLSPWTYFPSCVILVQYQRSAEDVYNLVKYLDRKANVAKLGGRFPNYSLTPESCHLIVSTPRELLNKVHEKSVRLLNVHLVFMVEHEELTSETESAMYELTGHNDMRRGETRRTKVVLLSTTITPKVNTMRDLLLKKCFVLVDTAAETARLLNGERPLMATTSSNGKATDSKRKKRDSVRSLMDEPTENSDLQENNVEEWLSEINQKLQNMVTGTNNASEENSEKVEGPLISF